MKTALIYLCVTVLTIGHVAAANDEDALIALLDRAKHDTLNVTELKSLCMHINGITASNKQTPGKALLVARSPRFFEQVISLKGQEGYETKKQLLEAREACFTILEAILFNSEATLSEVHLASLSQTKILLTVSEDISLLAAHGADEKNAGLYNVRGAQGQFLEPPEEMKQANLLKQSRFVLRALFLKMWQFLNHPSFYPTVDQRIAFFRIMGFSSVQIDDLRLSLPQHERNR